MKVLVVGQSYEDSFADCIGAAFTRTGHEVRRFDEYAALVPGGGTARGLLAVRLLVLFPWLERIAARKMLRAAAAFGPDLVLTNYVNITPSTIRAVKKETGAVVACWFPDSLLNFGRGYVIGADYDLFFTKDPYIVDFFRDKIGHKGAHFLPQACDSVIHVPPELTREDIAAYECDVMTAGLLYYYRARIFERLMDRDLRIYGSLPRWLESPLRDRHAGRWVWSKDKAKAFRAARIVLNTQHYAEIRGVNKRTFEVAGCGGFQITDEVPGLPGLFEPGREIVTFGTIADLREKVDHYLRHPEEREAIRDRGAARAAAEHTYEHRIARIVEEVRRLRPSLGPAAPSRATGPVRA